MDTIRCFICHLKTTAGKLLCVIRVQSVFFQLDKIDVLGKPRAPTVFLVEKVLLFPLVAHSLSFQAGKSFPHTVSK